MLHGSPCIQSGTFGPHCVNPLHSIGIHCTMLHGIYGIQLVYIRYTAWNELHSITLHGIHCIQSACIASYCMESNEYNHAAWTPLHSMTLHWIQCIQYGSIFSRCMSYTAFNRDQFKPAARNALCSIGLHLTMLHGIHCIQ